jgi:hypothetical protein
MLPHSTALISTPQKHTSHLNALITPATGRQNQKHLTFESLAVSLQITRFNIIQQLYMVLALL